MDEMPDFNRQLNNREVTRIRWRSRKSMILLVAVVNTLVLSVAFVGVRAYGYRLKTALRVAPFATQGPLFETGTFNNPAFLPDATLNADNRMISVGGRYACLPSEGEAVVQAIVSQESTGAFARGEFRGPCTGQIELFTVRAIVPEDVPAYQEGRVKIEALGINRTGTNQFTFNDFVFWGRFAMASKGTEDPRSVVKHR
jgi:hypothetical protein